MLAAAAARLNREAGGPAIPALYFFTDPARTPDPLAAARRLTRGTAVVYRHFGAVDRAHTARRLARLCKSRGLKLLIAADPDLAALVGADGVHWPERMAQARTAPGLITVAAHTPEAVQRAHALGADACVLSPVFQTNSASGRDPLGLFRASQIARRAPLPVIALGGVSQRNAHTFAGRGFAGFAAVDALMA